MTLADCFYFDEIALDWIAVAQQLAMRQIGHFECVSQLTYRFTATDGLTFDLARSSPLHPIYIVPR